jgi:arsenate reductase
MKNVLFVCVGNTCRSQMAEGFARVMGANTLQASSAGVAATGFVSPEVREVMEEEGIDISAHKSRQLTRKMVEKADLVVALGGNPELNYPDLLAGKLITWSVPDPFGQEIYRYRQVREIIKGKVLNLIIDLSRGRTPK